MKRKIAQSTNQTISNTLEWLYHPPSLESIQCQNCFLNLSVKKSRCYPCLRNLDKLKSVVKKAKPTLEVIEIAQVTLSFN